MAEVKGMAEFCLECWNKIMETNDSPKKFIISKDMDLCEECGEWKKVIVRVKRKYVFAESFRLLVNELIDR